jgi:glyoxalase family protein
LLRQNGLKRVDAMQLSGIHHLTAVTANARGNHDFYTQTMGLRLVKKTVNQDDVSAYHLFYADAKASPGSDITFFDWPVEREVRGSRTVTRTAFRVNGERTLQFWRDRLKARARAVGDVAEVDGRLTLEFEDFEGQRLALLDDGGRGASFAWEKSPVAPEHQIRGLGPITLTVPELSRTARVLTDVMNMRSSRDYAASGGQAHVFEMGEGGPAAELHVIERRDLGAARQGAGGVHHVAFRTPDETQYHAWTQRLGEFGIANSGEIDRFYFRSLYFREPGGILFEIATDGPGFATDEDAAHLGERLALPPFLEPKRKAIEAGLKPL